jgi:uncharacterized repeat protein (TIGR03806 family)
VTIASERVYPGLRGVDLGVVLRMPPNDSSRWYVGTRNGTVRMFENRSDVTSSSLVLDISAQVEWSCAECGLLGIAFHPDYPTTPKVYISYTSMERHDTGPDTHLSEFTTTDGGMTLDPSSEKRILTIYKPGVNHHAGNILFGRDGYLYMSVGDGNGAKIDVSQQMTSIKGKMIRIDIRTPSGDVPYSIPKDNPFASSTEFCNVTGSSSGAQNCPEIYASGFRNPWRWSFDRQTGDIWVGDVGESTIEEVDRIVKGGNYGWRCFEGTNRRTGVTCIEPQNPIPPIAQFEHTTGQAVTGGYVYRGKDYPDLVGKYIFADFSTGKIWAIANDTQPTVTVTADTALETGNLIPTFTEDNDGELYYLDIRGSKGVFRVTGAAAGPVTGGPPTLLSETGCVDANDHTKPASGLIPYKPNAGFWSDGAVKDRWMALPDDGQVSVGANGDWDFPNRTVLMKNFHLGNQLIETRLFMRHPDGVWAGYTYEWNADGKDATLVHGGKQKAIGDQTWIYPSESQCMMCHNQATGGPLGPETQQLAFNYVYPQTGRDANQLVTLNALNMLSPPITSPETVTPYPDPYGTAGTVAERARAYLHTNCSLCHRPGGPTSATMDLRYQATLADTKTCDVVPNISNLGIDNARIIAPGDPDRSVLLKRINQRGTSDQMPPQGLGMKIDEQGVALIREWIQSLSSCN